MFVASCCVLLVVVRWLLSVECNLFVVGRWSLFVVCGLLFVVCCVGYSLSFVV